MTASAPTPPSSNYNSESLADLRVQIDSLDQRLLSLLNERAHVAELVGEVKKREGTPFFRPDRVAQVIDKIRGNQNRPQQVMLLRDLCDTMVHGSLCAMGGMTPFPVLSALDHFPQHFGLVVPDRKAA